MAILTKALTFCLFLLLSTTALAQQGLVRLEEEKKIRFQSKILGRSQELLIRLPREYSTGKARYPLVLFFDAQDKTFANTVATTTDRLLWTHDIPEVILVGVPHQNRSADLSAERQASSSDLFRQSLTDEVLPHLDSLFRTLPVRVFIGYSIGGQFLCNAFAERPGVFNHVIAISPALYYPPTETWFHNRTYTNIRQALNHRRPTAAHLYWCSGTEGFQELAFRKGAQRLDSLLNHPYPAITSKYSVFQGFNHGTTPLVGIADGLSFVFREWHFSDTLAMSVLSTQKAAALPVLSAKQQQIKQAYGVDIPLPSFLYEQFGQQALAQKQYAAAQEITRQYIALNPAAMEPYGIMGDILAAKGERKQAIFYYREGLRLATTAEERDNYEKKIASLTPRKLEALTPR